MFRWLGLFLLLSFPALAAPAPACQDQFYQGQMPTALESMPPVPGSGWDKLGGPHHFICYSQYAAEESGLTKTALWSAEHLTADRVNAAKTIKRLNKFHAEKSIPPQDRAKLSDYLGSHYDRGHMSPDDDMPDPQSQFESFSLANMVPQDPCNNEIIWKAIETSVRNYVLTHGDVYVVTGPIFDDQNKTIGQDQVHVPTRLFKAVYDPRTNGLIIVVTPNANVQTYSTMTLTELEEVVGGNPFPAVSNPTPLTLPPLPQLTGACKKG